MHAQTLVCKHARAHALTRVCAHTDRYERGTHRYGSGVRICSPLSPPAGASATADGISESLRTDESSAAAVSASRSCITCACAFACIHSHVRACVFACARAPMRAGVLCVGLRMDRMHRHIGTHR